MHANIIDDKRFLKIQELLDDMEKEYGIKKKEILDKAETLKIPLSLFSTNLSSLELIVKFLIENRNIKNSDIGRMLGRSRQSIYQAYSSSKKKHPEPFFNVKSVINIPLSIFRKEESPLLTIIRYLRNRHGLRITDIARLLHRSPKTIWTTYRRAEQR